MHEKPVNLPMDFGEALARLARVPKPSKPKSKQKVLEKSASLGNNKPGALVTRRATGKRKSAS